MKKNYRNNFFIFFCVLLMLSNFLQAQKIDSSWYKPRILMGKLMPPIKGRTIEGEKIDSLFFDHKVVLLAFGNLVNIGSLQQIEPLNNIQKKISDTSFKILSIIPNSVNDVMDFNSSISNSSMGYQLRMTYNFPVMNYPVLASCSNRNPDNSLHVACDSVVKDFLIVGYPVIMLVDKKGIIRYVNVGMPPRESMQQWNDVIDKQIKDLLKEN